MTSFIPNYEHDIFVSYAHVDNQLLSGAENGWVSTLVENLRKSLGRKLGRAEKLSIFIDHKLSGNSSVTSEIMDAIKNSATLLVILSEGYLSSEWCNREKNTFLEKVADRVRSGSRVFVVEMDKLERNDRPSEFGDKIGVPFWVIDNEDEPPRTAGIPKPSSEDRPYWDKLNRLTHDLVSELRILKTSEASNPKEKHKQDTRTAVYLAETTDDLDTLREQVMQYLNQANLRILPDTMYYHRDPTTFAQKMNEDLTRCKLVVQLLSEAPGKKTPDLPQGYVGLQYERTLASGKPILQWKSQTIDENSVKDPDHQTLLQGNTVFQIGIEEFKQRIVHEAFYQPPPLSQPKISQNAYIFVDTEVIDRKLAKDVCQILERYGAGYVLPSPSETPAGQRMDLEENLLDCDALIIIYGNTEVKWVRQQIKQCLKSRFKRQHPLLACAIFEGPPEAKAPPDAKLPHMETIDCRHGLDEEKLKAFLDHLTLEASQ